MGEEGSVEKEMEDWEAALEKELSEMVEMSEEEEEEDGDRGGGRGGG